MKARKVKILIEEGAIRWPNECARCGAKDELNSVKAGIAQDVTPLLRRLTGERHFQTFELSYPVCREHARFTQFANWITRHSPLPNFLRVMAVLLGVPFIIVVGMALVRIGAALVARMGGAKADPGLSHMSLDGGFVMMLCMLAFAALLVGMVQAYRLLPLRLITLKPDTATLRFSNERFARRFIRVNADIVVEPR